MQLINKNDIVLIAYEKSHTMETNTLTLCAKRLSHSIKKIVRPVLMSKGGVFE